MVVFCWQIDSWIICPSVVRKQIAHVRMSLQRRFPLLATTIAMNSSEVIREHKRLQPSQFSICVESVRPTVRRRMPTYRGLLFHVAMQTNRDQGCLFAID